MPARNASCFQFEQTHPGWAPRITWLLPSILLLAGCPTPGAERGPHAPPSVETLLASARVEDRLAAVRRLGEGNDPAAGARLIDAMGDAEAQVRLAAVLATWRRGGRTAVVPLVDRLGDSDARVRCAAAYALRSLDGAQAREPLAGLLNDDDPAVRMHAGKLLVELGDPRGGAALAALGKEKGRPAKVALLTHIRALDSPEVVGLILKLAADTWYSDVSSAASSLLHNRYDDTAMGAYVAALQDPVERVRTRAIWSLGYSRSARAVEPLIASMNRDESGLNREYAAEALGTIGDARALGPILKALKAGKIDSFHAAEALGGLGKPGVPHLTVMLKGREGNDMVPLRAAQKLGNIGDPSAVPALIAALRHPYWGVRQASAKSLAKITGQKLGDDPAKWEQWQKGQKP